MAEGLPVIGMGLVVVLVIILSMFASIELILKFDQSLSKWAARGASPGTGPALEPSPESPEDSKESRGSRSGVIAAIGLALHQHLSESATARNAPAERSSGAAAWASSGRTEIMRSRSDMTGRYRRDGERAR